MAEYFHGILTINPQTGGSSNNWLALPALPAGMDPMRRVILRGSATYEVGWCTAGQATEDAGVMCSAGATQLNYFMRDLGVVNYTRLTARSNNVDGSTASLYVYSLSRTDEGPRGM